MRSTVHPFSYKEGRWRYTPPVARRAKGVHPAPSLPITLEQNTASLSGKDSIGPECTAYTGGVKQTREGKSEVHCQLGQHSRGAQQILMKLGAGALTELHFATRPLFDPPMPVPM